MLRNSQEREQKSFGAYTKIIIVKTLSMKNDKKSILVMNVIDMNTITICCNIVCTSKMWLFM